MKTRLRPGINVNPHVVNEEDRNEGKEGTSIRL